MYEPVRWFLYSKTIIISILTTLAGILGLLVGEGWIQEYPDVVAILTIVLGIVNAIIRGVTDRPITLTPPRA